LKIDFRVTITKSIKYEFVIVELEVPDADGTGISAVITLRAVIQQVMSKHDATVVIEIDGREVSMKIAIFDVKIGSPVHVSRPQGRVR
jgi:hypothetical protein